MGRPLRAAIVGAIAASMAAAAPAADAACGGVERAWPAKQRRPGTPPLALGDSVMLGAIGQLSGAGFQVDVRGCRQMSEGLGALSSRRRAGSLPDVVVVALGYNWTISIAEIGRARRILGPERVLGMVTPRGPYGSARAAIRAAGRRWPVRVKVLDWATHSAGKAWTWDGLHLTPSGARGFTRLLSRAFAWPLPADVEEAPDGGAPALSGRAFGRAEMP